MQKDIWSPMFLAALCTIAKLWKQLRCSSIDEWIKKTLYLYNGILFNHKKETLPFATTQMDLEGIMLSEIRQRKRNTE